MKKFTNKEIVIAGLIGAIYAVTSIATLPISFGVYQVRIAEALTILPFISRAAIPGLFIGCLIANLYGGMGWQDVVLGSLLTLVSAMITYAISKRFKQPLSLFLAPAPPVLFNAFGVSAYLAPIIGVSYLFSVQMVGLGQLIACYLLGIPLLKLLEKRKFLFN